MRIKEIILMPPVKRTFDLRAHYARSLNLVNYKFAEARPPLPGINSRVFFEPKIAGRDSGDNYKFYILDKNQTPVFYVSVSTVLDGIKISSVAKAAGTESGIGLQVYPALVDYFDLPLYSDSTQTEASRRGIWQRLIDKYPDRLVAYDPKSKQEMPLNSQVLSKVYQTLPDDELDDLEHTARSTTLLLKFKPGK